jgi:hypothetical protein
VKKVKLNPLFLDRGVQLHRHIDGSKVDISFPGRSSRHEKSSEFSYDTDSIQTFIDIFQLRQYD